MQENRLRKREENMEELMASIEQIRSLIEEYREDQEGSTPVETRRSHPVEPVRTHAEELITRAEITAGELLDQADRMLAESSERSRKMIAEAEQKVQEAEQRAQTIRQNAEEAASRIREEAGRSARETQRRMTAENSQVLLDARKEAEDVHANAVKEAEEILFHAQQEADRIRREAQEAIPESEEEQARARARELLEEARNEAQQVLQDAGDEAQRLIDEANEENRRMVQEAHDMLANTRDQADHLLASAHSNAQRIVGEAEEVSATRKLEIVRMEQDAESSAMKEDSEKTTLLQQIPEKTSSGHLLMMDLALLVFLALVFAAAFVLSTKSGLDRRQDLILGAGAVVPVLFMAYRFRMAAWILAAVAAIVSAVWKLMPVFAGRAVMEPETVLFVLLPLVLTMCMQVITSGIVKGEQIDRSVRETKASLKRIDPVTALYGKPVLLADLRRMKEQGKTPSVTAVFLEMHEMETEAREALLRQTGVLLENLVFEEARVYACSTENCFLVLSGCDEAHAEAMEEGILEHLNRHPSLQEVHAEVRCQRRELSEGSAGAEAFVANLMNREEL